MCWMNGDREHEHSMVCIRPNLLELVQEGAHLGRPAHDVNAVLAPAPPAAAAPERVDEPHRAVQHPSRRAVENAALKD
jgi:hypothetical protein